MRRGGQGLRPRQCTGSQARNRGASRGGNGMGMRGADTPSRCCPHHPSCVSLTRTAPDPHPDTTGRCCLWVAAVPTSRATSAGTSQGASHRTSLLSPLPFLCFKTQGSDSDANPHPSARHSLRNSARPTKAPMDKHAGQKSTRRARWHPAGITKAKATAAFFAPPWCMVGCKPCARPHCHCGAKRGESWPAPAHVTGNFSKYRSVWGQGPAPARGARCSCRAPAPHHWLQLELLKSPKLPLL